MELLDDLSVINQKDTKGTLQAAPLEWQQLTDKPVIEFHGDPAAQIQNIVLAGMGGSGLAAGIAHDWLKLSVPIEVVRSYDLPVYADKHSLVVASSFSGNTEETISIVEQAVKSGCQLVVAAGGGTLIDIATEQALSYVKLPHVVQQRMGVVANLFSTLVVLRQYNLIDDAIISEYQAVSGWLKDELAHFAVDVKSADNPAKQIAWHCAGKSVVVYASSRFESIAYKWKININESGKNVAAWNVYPEFDHNEFLGWTSHPVDKPYAIFNLKSSFDHPQVTKRFEISERLLSGRRPQAQNIELKGDSMIAQMLWANALADFVGSYLAVLNGTDPGNVDLIEKLKAELK